MKIIAYANFAAAAILLLAAADGGVGLLSLSVTAVISGCLFLAIDQALSLLAEIRDRLPEPITKQEPQPTVLPEGKTVRSFAEIEADLAKMKSKVQD